MLKSHCVSVFVSALVGPRMGIIEHAKKKLLLCVVWRHAISCTPSAIEFSTLARERPPDEESNEVASRRRCCCCRRQYSKRSGPNPCGVTQVWRVDVSMHARAQKRKPRSTH